ncbi:MAG TPA: hypothetical protein V6D21_14670 [Candidatus Obscuribacterales bacterium]
MPQIFGKVVIPQVVFDELQTGQHPAASFVQNLAWLEVLTVNNQQVVEELQRSFNLDWGNEGGITLIRKWT